MRRREFITVLAGAVAWSTAGRSQQPPRIGYLSPVTSSADAPRREAFLRGLAEHGYIEGRNILVEWRFADGVLSQLVSARSGVSTTQVSRSLSPPGVAR